MSSKVYVEYYLKCNVTMLWTKRTCYISCILKSGTTLTSIFLDKNCVNSRQCSFMTQGRYWTPIDPLATLKSVSRGTSKVNHAGDVTGPLYPTAIFTFLLFFNYVKIKFSTFLKYPKKGKYAQSNITFFCIYQILFSENIKLSSGIRSVPRGCAFHIL